MTINIQPFDVTTLINNILQKKFNFKEKYNNFSSNQIAEIIINYYEEMINFMPGNVYWLDQEGIALGCNKNTLDMFGLTSLAQFKGLSFEDMADMNNWTYKSMHQFKTDTLKVINTGKAKLNIEEPPIPDVKGQLIYFSSNRVPLFDQKGKTIGIVGISIDVTERKKIEIAQQQARDAAEAAYIAKTNFIANMSYDIQNSLTGIINMAQILGLQLKEPQQKLYALCLKENSDILLRLINKILM